LKKVFVSDIIKFSKKEEIMRRIILTFYLMVVCISAGLAHQAPSKAPVSSSEVERVSVAQPSTIRIEKAWVRPGIKGKTTALYMQIINSGDKPVDLIAVVSNVAGKIELHKTCRKKGDVYAMEHQQGITCPPYTVTELKPGDFHVMLIDLKQDLLANKDQTIALTLRFSNGKEILLNSVPIREKPCCGSCH
jgi:copper(I)-binding protein